MGIDNQNCISCRHFRNSPRYLESAYKGFTSFSSTYASASKDDGICLKKEIYLLASGTCKHFAAR